MDLKRISKGYDVVGIGRYYECTLVCDSAKWGNLAMGNYVLSEDDTPELSIDKSSAKAYVYYLGELQEEKEVKLGNVEVKADSIYCLFTFTDGETDLLVIPNELNFKMTCFESGNTYHDEPLNKIDVDLNIELSSIFIRKAYTDKNVRLYQVNVKDDISTAIFLIYAPLEEDVFTSFYGEYTIFSNDISPWNIVKSSGCTNVSCISFYGMEYFYPVSGRLQIDENEIVFDVTTYYGSTIRGRGTDYVIEDFSNLDI